MIDPQRAVDAERVRIRAAVEAVPTYWPRFNGQPTPWPDEIMKAMKDRVLAEIDRSRIDKGGRQDHDD